VPSNIAEGHTRESTKEYLKHLSMAQVSLAEAETQLERALRLEYAEALELKPVFDECFVLGKQLYRLRDALQKRI
jgi:four helix bundle protein